MTYSHVMMEAAQKEKWVKVSGVVERGHGVASGQADDSPYPEGTIPMQMPFFETRGLDLTKYHPATINISIKPYHFTVINPAYTFQHVEWTHLHPPEHFSFSRCKITYDNKTYDGWVYYPHPETKERHFQNDHILEIISEHIPNIGHGDEIEVMVNPEEIEIKKS